MQAFEGERFRRYRDAVARRDLDALHQSCKDCKVYQAEFDRGLGASDYGVTGDDPRRAAAQKR